MWELCGRIGWGERKYRILAEDSKGLDLTFDRFPPDEPAPMRTFAAALDPPIGTPVGRSELTSTRRLHASVTQWQGFPADSE